MIPKFTFKSGKFPKFTRAKTTTNFPPTPKYLTLLQTCSNMTHLKMIHSQLIIHGFIGHTYVQSKLLAFCALSHYGDINYTHSIFNVIKIPTIFDWNTMIKAYSISAKPEMGILVYVQMRSNMVVPNRYTFPVLIKTCTCLFTVCQVHGQVLKFGFSFDDYVISSLINVYSMYGVVGLARRVFYESLSRNVVCWTSLITAYCSHGLVDEGRKLFDQMPERSGVSWSAMISGYVRNACFSEAIELFHELKGCGDLNPNQRLLVSVLNACACSGAFVEGKRVHSYIDEQGFEYGLELGTALVYFYAKCGYVEVAEKVFHRMHDKDVMSWSAMIMGVATNGFSDLALKHFVDMEKSGIKPNAITFIGVLTACSHGGLVDEGWRFFESMSRHYGISPRIEHYGCMVDLLGRAGKIKEAEKLIDCMPIEPDAIIWGALLNGCIMHEHTELAERVGKHLIEVDPQHSGRYVILANMYATIGRWHGVSEIRRLKKERGITTVSAWSFIDIDGDVQRFIVGGKSHPQTREIYELLNLLSKELTTSNSGTLVSVDL